MSTIDDGEKEIKNETSNDHQMDYRQPAEQPKPRMYLLKNVMTPSFDPQNMLTMKFERSLYDIKDILEHRRIAEMPKNDREKNKMAMKTRREYDMEYRMRENHRNKIAMRLKRSNNYDYRVRENERNKIAMQMRRKMERDKSEDIVRPLPVDVQLSAPNENPA